MRWAILMCALSFVSHGESIQAWPKESMRGRVEIENRNIWNVFGGTPKKINLIVEEDLLHGYVFEKWVTLAFASQVDLNSAERYDTQYVEVTGFWVKRGEEKWFLVDSVRSAKQ